MYKMKRCQSRIFYPHGIRLAYRFLLIEIFTSPVCSFTTEAFDKTSSLKAVVFWLHTQTLWWESLGQRQYRTEKKSTCRQASTCAVALHQDFTQQLPVWTALRKQSAELRERVLECGNSRVTQGTEKRYTERREKEVKRLFKEGNNNNNTEKQHEASEKSLIY